ncbi:MAG TPA: RNA-binding domain-containing protein [Candidatus Kapabacteria bacterium]|nr:RNA-binding domain-containing protein [Candidatus Kapabacteria bacterium]
MNELELKFRIEKGEDFHTEFKETLGDKEKIIKEIVSFANTDGGQLIFGVTDSGGIPGIENIDELMRIIDDLAYQRCEPPITVVQETVKIDDKTILIANIPKGSQRPYRTSGGHYYVRSSNRCRQASREELLRLFQAGECIYFDETTVHRANFKDLDLDSFDEFLQNYLKIKAHESELVNYLKNLHLVDEDNIPTTCGILFFGKKPQFFFQSSRVICAYIKGKDLATPPFNKKDITGRIPAILENTENFIDLYLREEHVIKGFEPEIRREIPPAALREAIVNAISHKDYTLGAPIRVIIYEDRVEIRTPGKLPNSVTIESIKIGGSHILRNPTIYNLLYKMGMVTDLGSGVRRIIALIKEHSAKEISLQETENEFILTLPRI